MGSLVANSRYINFISMNLFSIVFPSLFICQVGDEPVEILYDCFLLDKGHHECISERNIRMLPSYPKELSPLANDFNFALTKRPDWEATSTASFRELSMATLKNCVPTSTGENYHIASAVPFVLVASSCNKFNPKYSKRTDCNRIR